MTPGVLSNSSRARGRLGRAAGRLLAVGWLLSALFLTQCALMPARSRPLRLDPATWSAGDGKSLPYAHWPAAADAHRREAPPKAVLICVHGLSGASSDFWPLGQELPKRGLAVYGMELRGQGLDPDVTARGDIRHRREWLRDLREFSSLVAAEHPGVPVFWLGESMGSLIALNTLVDGPREESARPRGLILLSPAVDLREELPRWKGHFARAASRVAPWYRIPLAQLDPSQVPDMRITSESTQASQAPLTPHLVPAHSLRLLREVHSLMRGSRAAAEKLELPVLVFYTPNDPVASQRQIEAWFDTIDSLDKTSLLFPKDYHLILHDEHRWQAVTDIGDWLLGHVPKATPVGRAR